MWKKWRSLFFLFTCFLMQKLVSGEDEAIKLKKISDTFEFECSNGQWKNNIGQKKIQLKYNDDSSGVYECVDTNNEDNNVLSTITVRFRTCDNCVQLDAVSLSAIIVGSLVSTVLIAWAVYSIIAQPKGKSFSGNKASDKMNLLTNGDGDTYQPLNPGQSSEYSGLAGVRKK